MNLSAHTTTPQNHAVSWIVFPSNSNGKEKDYESGFHYYGARYYWSELLTGWLSVDPMVDKFPNVSPYAYCSWNPVLFVDPDGEEKLIWFDLRAPRMARSDTQKSWESRKQTYNNNLALKGYATRFSDRSDVIHVFAHGDEYAGKSTGRLYYNDMHLSVHGFVQNVLMKSDTYKNSGDNNPCVIMLHCCYSGQGEKSFAQNLSLGGNLVIAPSDACNIRPQSGKESVDKNGVWNVFLNGEKIVSLKGDETNTQKLLNLLKEKSPAEVHEYFKKKYVKNEE